MSNEHDSIGRPQAGEYGDFHAGYVGLVPELDILRNRHGLP